MNDEQKQRQQDIIDQVSCKEIFIDGIRWAVITTGELDRHNDYIVLYATQTETGYLLTDDGHALTDIQFCGQELDQKILDIITRRFGVRVQDGALEAEATATTFEARKRDLTYAVTLLCLFHDAAALTERLERIRSEISEITEKERT